MKNILIRYCPVWLGYPDAAVAAQEELKKELLTFLQKDLS